MQTALPGAFAPLLALALAACTLPAKAPSQSDTRIALERDEHGHVLLPVEVGHAKGRLLLDTGASADGITPAFAKTLGLHAKESAVGVGAGGVDEAWSVELPEMRIDRTLLPAHEGCITGLGDEPATVVGVLGKDFLAAHVVTIDFAHGVLALSQTPTANDDTSLVSLPFRETLGLPTIDVELGHGRNAPAIFDLGATQTLLDTRAARIAALADEPAKAAVGYGADEHAVSLSARTLKTLRAGGAELGPLPIVVGDLPVFEQLGFKDAPAMLLGIDAWAGRVLVLDAGRKRIAFSRERATR